jgi:hypothetical protein
MNVKKRRPEQLDKLCMMFDSLSIEKYKKSVLQERYLDVLHNFQIRANTLSFLFYTSRIVVTVGSILVPAFLSIQGTTYQAPIYWTTWVISVFVTICNGLMTLFKLDKKYFFIHTTLELLKSEGWQYIGLSGRYSHKEALITPTHENQFLVFFHMAEKIKMRQVEEEYWKFTDTSGVGNATNQKPMAPLQTPMSHQDLLSLLPTEKRTIIAGWLDDMNDKPMMDGILPRNKIDGQESPSTFPKIANETLLSMRSELPTKPSSKNAMVFFSQPESGTLPGQVQEPQNEIINVSNQPGK